MLALPVYKVLPTSLPGPQQKPFVVRETTQVIRRKRAPSTASAQRILARQRSRRWDARSRIKVTGGRYKERVRDRAASARIPRPAYPVAEFESGRQELITGAGSVLQ